MSSSNTTVVPINGSTATAKSSSNSPAATVSLTIGKLEADYPTYCKALRLLIREGNSLNKIKKTVCWDRLQMLHNAMPRAYRDPMVHYGMLKRDIDAAAA